jgi:hypothetical protein
MAMLPRKSGKSKSGNSKKKADEGTERDRALLEQLKEVGGRIGIEVREERLVREVGYSVRSGRCRVNGQEVILLDRNAAISERTEALLESLATCDLSEIYLEPEIRQLLRSDADAGDDAGQSTEHNDSGGAGNSGEQSSGA